MPRTSSLDIAVRAGLLVAAFFSLTGVARSAPTESIERLHADLWARFVYPPGLLLDYTGLDGKVDELQPDDFAQAKPNALAWWSPKENGPFFTGLYLDGMVRRWQFTGAEADRANARTLSQGLLRCASVGSAPGFIARGIGTDGKSHHALGSDDQTGPWFYGLWRYLRSGAASPEEVKIITAKLIEVATAIERNQWRLPVDPVGAMSGAGFRGSFHGLEYREASRLLFIARIMAELTRDARWMDVYKRSLAETGKGGKTRLSIVQAGMPGEVAEFPPRGVNQLWIFVVSQAMVRELVELESDPTVKAAYLDSLRVTARSALAKITDHPPAGLGTTPFSTDWRRLNSKWAPQTTVAEAEAVARAQLTLWKNPGRELETVGVREPFCAAWLVLLAPLDEDPKTTVARDKFSRLMETMPWTQLHSSAGFFGEAAWYLWNEQSVRR